MQIHEIEVFAILLISLITPVVFALLGSTKFESTFTPTTFAFSTVALCIPFTLLMAVSVASDDIDFVTSMPPQHYVTHNGEIVTSEHALYILGRIEGTPQSFAAIRDTFAYRPGQQAALEGRGNIERAQAYYRFVHQHNKSPLQAIGEYIKPGMSFGELQAYADSAGVRLAAVVPKYE